MTGAAPKATAGLVPPQESNLEPSLEDGYQYISTASILWFPNFLFRNVRGEAVSLPSGDKQRFSTSTRGFLMKKREHLSPIAGQNAAKTHTTRAPLSMNGRSNPSRWPGGTDVGKLVISAVQASTSPRDIFSVQNWQRYEMVTG